MIAACLTAAALAKPPKPPKPAPVAAPKGPAPPAAPAGPAAWPAELLPGVGGATEVLTGERNLARNTATMAFEFDLSGLDRLDAAGVDALFTLLAADGAWRVVPTPAGRVATLVDEAPGLGGWIVRPEGCARLAITEVREPRLAGPRVTTAPAGAGTASVKAFQPGDGPADCRTWATALVIDGARLDVELYETGAVDERPFTLEAFRSLPSLLTWARLDAAVLAAHGHREAPHPPGPPRLGPGPVPGTLLLEDAVNPGAPGRVWLRVLDAAGAPWAEATVGPATLQLAGWSDDPAHGFPVRAVVPVPAGPAFSGTAEWWFQGADGAVRRIASRPLAVPAR